MLDAPSPTAATVGHRTSPPSRACRRPWTVRLALMGLGAGEEQTSLPMPVFSSILASDWVLLSGSLASPWQRKSIATQDEAQEGAGRACPDPAVAGEGTPAPRRPRPRQVGAGCPHYLPTYLVTLRAFPYSLYISRLVLAPPDWPEQGDGLRPCGSTRRSSNPGAGATARAHAS
jgi:hypothetical protein